MGAIDVHPAEDDAGDGRSAASEDDAIHAGDLHLHVLNLPSGLVLYWTLSNVLQIAQQKYMERTTSQIEKRAQLPKKA
jgi:hypothetical protein